MVDNTQETSGDGSAEPSGDGSARGRVGVEIFEQVERIMSEEGLSRTQAFQRISEETGRRAGTVAANYYRVARQRGAALQPRASRSPRRARRGRPPKTDVETALANATSALEGLAAAVRRQEQELGRLREQSEQFERLRRWMDKNVG